MTTITINKNTSLDKVNFDDVEDLRKYLNELEEMRAIETPELFEELKRRDEEADKNPSSLRTWDQVASRLDAYR